MEVRKDVRYVLSLARIMLENNFDQYRKGFLEHQYYAGTIEPQVKVLGKLLLNLDVPMSELFKDEVKRIIEIRV